MKKPTEFKRCLELAKERHPDKIVPSGTKKKGKVTFKPILGLLTPKQVFAIFKMMEAENYFFHISVSDENTKLGTIPSISLPAGTSCEAWVWKACAIGGCYAMKGHFMYNSYLFSVLKNWYIHSRDQGRYFKEVSGYLTLNNPRFFRWHVGGDIQNQAYYASMVETATKFPDIKFLVFTKKYFLDFKERPANLAVILSAWPGHPVHNPHVLPIAYMQDGKETRMTEEDLECPGTCTTCAACWNLPKLNRNVVFHKH